MVQFKKTTKMFGNILLNERKIWYNLKRQEKCLVT